MTISTAYQTALENLLKNACDEAESRATARILTDEISGFAHAHLTRGGEVLPASQLARFEIALRELQNGRPLAYVLGRRNFYRLRFRCDERALVPRPETELLVETALAKLETRKLETQNPESTNYRIADLGTGSGCIAISLAHELPRATIYATDVSAEALTLAQQNASTLIAENRARNRLFFLPGVLGDWAAPLLSLFPEYSGTFDLIVSNPPYIARAEIEELQREVRDFEPRLALDGGEDGLDCYRQLASQCGVLLKPQGALLCELGMGQFQDVRAIFQAQDWRVENPVFDFAGIARILIATCN